MPKKALVTFPFGWEALGLLRFTNVPLVAPDLGPLWPVKFSLVLGAECVVQLLVTRA